MAQTDPEVSAAVESAKAAQARALETVKGQVDEALGALPMRLTTFRSLELAHELDRVSDLLKKKHWLQELMKG